MSEFNIQAESIDVERIMQQVRNRIKEKRGQDYTEAEIRKLANVKLERFLNPHDVRSDLVKHYRRRPAEVDGETSPDPSDFDADTIYRSSRSGIVGKLLFWIRRRLNFILKLFINPIPITDALHSQNQLNRLNFELMNNLVVEMTRLAIEMKNLRMRVESIAARLDFDERRSRALEGAVQYREDGTSSSRAAGNNSVEDGNTPSPERKRRRRRRRRRPATVPVVTNSVSPQDTNVTAPAEPATAATPGPRQTAPNTPQPLQDGTAETSRETKSPEARQSDPSDETGS